MKNNIILAWSWYDLDRKYYVLFCRYQSINRSAATNKQLGRLDYNHPVSRSTCFIRYLKYRKKNCMTPRVTMFNGVKESYDIASKNELEKHYPIRSHSMCLHWDKMVPFRNLDTTTLSWISALPCDDDLLIFNLISLPMLWSIFTQGLIFPFILRLLPFLDYNNRDALRTVLYCGAARVSCLSD